MTLYAGPLNGKPFAANLPFLILGWPSPSAVTTFANKISLWNYLESARHRDPQAVLTHAYGFEDGHWLRIPTLPAYLTRCLTTFPPHRL